MCSQLNITVSAPGAIRSSYFKPITTGHTFATFAGIICDGNETRLDQCAINDTSPTEAIDYGAVMCIEGRIKVLLLRKH